MQRLNREEIARLRIAILDSYPDDRGESEFSLLCRDKGYDYKGYRDNGRVYRDTALNQMLNYYNINAPGLDPLLDALAKPNRPDLKDLVTELRDRPTAAKGESLKLLRRQHLLIEGLPLLNHDNLRTNLLYQLLDSDFALRVVCLSGPTDSGKTFSRGLIMSRCLVEAVRCIVIDPVSAATDRSSVALAQTIARRLGLQGFKPPEPETSQSKLERRLVDYLGDALVDAYLHEPEPPRVLLVFDHLNKEVSPQVLELIREIAIGAADLRLPGIRVIMISCPEGQLHDIQPGRIALERLTQPGPQEVEDYLRNVSTVLKLELDKQELSDFVHEIYEGRPRPPYERDFMRRLPEQSSISSTDSLIWGTLRNERRRDIKGRRGGGTAQSHGGIPSGRNERGGTRDLASAPKYGAYTPTREPRGATGMV